MNTFEQDWYDKLLQAFMNTLRDKKLLAESLKNFNDRNKSR